jgi:hypothetical protein
VLRSRRGQEQIIWLSFVLCGRSLLQWLSLLALLLLLTAQARSGLALALLLHSQRSTLRCGNQVKWVSGTLRGMFLPKVGFAVPPNYAFKPTAGEVIRFNQPLRAGGGLTRR